MKYRDYKRESTDKWYVDTLKGRAPESLANLAALLNEYLNEADDEVLAWQKLWFTQIFKGKKLGAEIFEDELDQAAAMLGEPLRIVPDVHLNGVTLQGRHNTLEVHLGEDNKIIGFFLAH